MNTFFKDVFYQNRAEDQVVKDIVPYCTFVQYCNIAPYSRFQ